MKFTWKITNPAVTFVYLEVLDSQGNKKVIDSNNRHKYVSAEISSFETTSLTTCEEFTLKAQSTGRTDWSDFAEKTFWLTGTCMFDNLVLCVSSHNLFDHLNTYFY